MLDSEYEEEGAREPAHEAGMSLGSANSEQSGFTDFLINDPNAPEVSREAMSEAIRSLIRERDYLRKIRDVQQAEHESQLDAHRAQTAELKRERDALLEDREAWRKRATWAEESTARALWGLLKQRVRRLLNRTSSD